MAKIKVNTLSVTFLYCPIFLAFCHFYESLTVGG